MIPTLLPDDPGATSALPGGEQKGTLSVGRHVMLVPEMVGNGSI